MAPLEKKKFLSLPLQLTPPNAIPMSVCNRSFNRSLDVLPTPATRVVLTPLRDMDYDVYTYVNANFVRSATGEPRGYIVGMGSASYRFLLC
jgi:hypothetical protein